MNMLALKNILLKIKEKSNKYQSKLVENVTEISDLLERLHQGIRYFVRENKTKVEL